MKKLPYLLWFFLIPWIALSQSWSAFSDGFTNDWVVDLKYYQGDLYACGFFTTIGGVSANRVARYNGSSWEPLGEGLNGRAHSLYVYQDALYVTGYFTEAGGQTVNYLARWNGQSWSDVGGGFDGNTIGILEHEGQLVVIGEFKLAGDQPAKGAAAWDGQQWSALGSGFAEPFNQYGTFPHGIIEYGGELIVGGNFTQTGSGEVVNGIARWDGESWKPMGIGFNSSVLGFAIYQGDLIAGGEFTGFSNGQFSRGIARWNGSEWVTLGSQNGDILGWVHTLQVFNGGLYAAGGFETTASVPPHQLNNIARFDGTNWQALGGGLNAEVEPMIPYEGQLLVGGNFTQAGGTSASRLAIWEEEVSTATTLVKEEVKIKVYPNPAQEILNIEWKGSALYKLTILNQAGQIVFSQGGVYRKTSVSINELPEGMYFVKLEGADGVIAGQFLISE